MSIEYQLYSMSLTNHIIIPIVGSKQNLQEQNIFVSSYFNLTPQKQEDVPDLGFWKKSMSAFKKFKQKKDKKDKKHSLDVQQQQDNYLQCKRGFSKLVKRKSKQDSICSLLKYEEYLQCYKYYDPNDAPLYELQIQTNFQFKLKGIKSAVSRPQQMDQEIHEIKMVKIQSQINEQELPLQPIIQSRFDDPFIIIRKDNIKKTNKSIKSKPIKKDKIIHKHLEEKHQSHVFQAITIKPKISNNQDLIKKEDPSPKNTSTLSQQQQNNTIKFNRYQQSENSQQDNGNNDVPLKIKRQMHTLQQIFKQANQKNSIQPARSIKQRQKLFNYMKNDEISQSECIQ